LKNCEQVGRSFCEDTVFEQIPMCCRRHFIPSSFVVKQREDCVSEFGDRGTQDNCRVEVSIGAGVRNDDRNARRGIVQDLDAGLRIIELARQEGSEAYGPTRLGQHGVETTIVRLRRVPPHVEPVGDEADDARIVRNPAEF
jgi:hypothetical protein